MAKRIAIVGGIVLAVLALAALAGFLYMRSYFSEPSAKAVASVAGAADAGRVLGVFAHPDDEQLVTGFFTAAKKDGAFTSLVTGTKGEAGHQVPVVARQSDLGIVRKAEALKNGFALGIDDQEVWDYPDGGVPEAPMDELVARVSAKIVAVQPDLLVTFWPASGATGHKDHMRMGLVAETAAREVRAQHAAGGYRGPRWIAYVITPSKGLRTFGGETGRFVADNQPEPTHAMPGNTSAKLRGWKIHASQEHYVQAAYGFPDWLLYALWDREFYHVVDLDAAP